MSRPAENNAASRSPLRNGASPGPQHGTWLPVILLAALVLRVVFVLIFEHLPAMTIGGERVPSPAQRTLFPDSAEYLRMADHIRAGRGPIISDECRLGRMPGYAIFLAGLRALFGRSLLAVRLVQALIATGAVWLVALLARELFGQAEGLWAAAIAAVYPFFIIYSGLVLTETVSTALLLGGLWCLLAAVRQERWVPGALAGGLLGLAVLARASLLPGVLLLAAGWVILWRPRRRALGGAACMLAAFAVVLTPWVVRNWYVSGGHVVVTTSRAGASLYEALNPKADGGPMLEVVNEVPRPAGLDEVERDQQLRRLAVAFALEHPGRTAWLALVKLGRTWNPVPNAREFRSPLLCVAVAVPYVAVMLLAAVGLVGAWRRGDVALILLLPVVYHAILHMVFVGSLRYRAVVMPLVVVLAARGLCAAWVGRAAASRGVDAH